MDAQKMREIARGMVRRGENHEEWWRVYVEPEIRRLATEGEFTYVHKLAPNQPTARQEGIKQVGESKGFQVTFQPRSMTVCWGETEEEKAK